MSAHRRYMAGIVLVAAAVAPTSVAPQQSATSPPTADSVVLEWVQEERIPGAVLLVWRDGQVVFEKAYGYAQLYEYDEGQYGASAAGEPRPAALRRLAEPRLMTTDTVFDLASVTKVMATTFAVMLLVDSGRLDLDATVHTYLPDFGETGGKDKITLRRLLTHRSGLSQWQPIYYHAADSGEANAYIRDLPLAWDVGEERHYSDLGFMLLGLIVERVSEQTLGNLLRERLYGPLGLASTEFRPAAGPFAATSHGNPFEQRIVHDTDFGYRIEGDPDVWDGWRRHTLVGEVNDGNAFHAFGGEAGHAGLFSTAGEVQVLLQLLLNRGEYGGRRYISAALIDEFLAPTGDGQALGWQVPSYTPPGSFNHTGFTGTYVLGVPAENLALVLLTNRQNLGVDDAGQYPDVGELQRAVVRAVVESR